MNRIMLPMLLGLSLAPILCWAAEPKADEAKAIAAIEKLGGRVTRDEKSPGRPVVEVNLWGTKVTDTGLEYLKELTRLQDLNLAGTRVTDAGLVHLKGLTKLQGLHLRKAKVTDAGVKELLKALPNCKIDR